MKLEEKNMSLKDSDVSIEEEDEQPCRGGTGEERTGLGWNTSRGQQQEHKSEIMRE